MAYVPALPNVIQSTYGQGYGDWSQYAGFNKKDNPFGNNPMDFSRKPQVSSGTPPPELPKLQALPPTDYSIAPQMGVKNTTSMGMPNQNQMGTPDIVSNPMSNDNVKPLESKDESNDLMKTMALDLFSF